MRDRALLILSLCPVSSVNYADSIKGFYGSECVSCKRNDYQCTWNRNVRSILYIPFGRIALGWWALTRIEVFFLLVSRISFPPTWNFEVFRVEKHLVIHILFRVAWLGKIYCRCGCTYIVRHSDNHRYPSLQVYVKVFYGENEACFRRDEP